jgi:hypothetical protein
MELTTLIDELADSAEAMTRTLRAIAGELARKPAEQPVVIEADQSSALARALALHPVMGARQRSIIRLVEREGDHGADTGTLSREMGYDQPNVYLTLQGLIRRDFIRRDANAHPHRYYLGRALLDGEDA